jgi:hypothetical protein
MNSTRKSKDASDPQAQKFYDWTWQWLDWNVKQMGLKDCRELIRKICAAWQVPMPKVLAVSAQRHFSDYDDEGHQIRLIPSHHNMATSIHEAAHAIVYHHYPGAQDHGPTFVGVFLDLMDQAEIAPREALYTSARKAGLKIRKVNKKAR